MRTTITLTTLLVVVLLVIATTLTTAQVQLNFPPTTTNNPASSTISQYQPTQQAIANPPTPHGNGLAAAPKVFVYVHPWGQTDSFLSIDCMIRAQQFLPTDTYSISIKPVPQTSLNTMSAGTGSDNQHNPTTYDYNDMDQTQTHHTTTTSSTLFPTDDPTTLTPFTKVYVTPFTSGTQCANVQQYPVNPAQTKVETKPIPFPINTPLKNTENWINFRWEGPDSGEIHDLARFQVEFIYTTIDPVTGDPLPVPQQATIIQKLPLAHGVVLTNYRYVKRNRDDESIKNQFTLNFKNVDYKLRSVMIALHGNHYFDGSFNSCTINNVPVSSAYQLDVGVNITVTDTPMGQQPNGTYLLECNDAFLSAQSLPAFKRQTVLSISGQPDSFWEDPTVYPAFGSLIDDLKYELLPNYTPYWISIFVLFVASTIASVIIIKCWGLDDKRVMVM